MRYGVYQQITDAPDTVEKEAGVAYLRFTDNITRGFGTRTLEFPVPAGEFLIETPWGYTYRAIASGSGLVLTRYRYNTDFPNLERVQAAAVNTLPSDCLTEIEFGN